VPVTVRNGTHKLIVEGLVQNQVRSVVTTSASDVTDYVSYLPIYRNESRVIFQQKYVSLFITLDNLAYVVPANSPGVYVFIVVYGGGGLCNAKLTSKTSLTARCRFLASNVIATLNCCVDDVSVRLCLMSQMNYRLVTLTILVCQKLN